MARNQGLMFRLENASAAALGSDADASLELNANATQAVEEVESASGDVTEVETGIGDAETAQEELADVQELVEEAVEDGDGLTPREAAHVEARLEHIANLLGTTAAAQGLVFRRESFGGAQSRLAATKLRLEGIKEMGTKVWEVIKAGWQWLKDAIVNLYTKITGNVDAVEKRLKDLKGRADGVSATAKPKNDKMKAGAKAFSVGGNTNKQSIETVLSDVTDGTALITKLCQESEPSKVEGRKDHAAAGADMTSLIAASLKTKQAALPKGAAEGSTGYGNLLGGQTLIVSPDKKTVGGKELALIKVSFGNASDKTADDYAAFNKSDLSSLATSGLAMVSVLKDFAKVKKAQEQAIAVNIKFCESRSKISTGSSTAGTDDKDKQKGFSDDAAAFAAVMSQYGTVSRAIGTKLPAMAFQAAVAVADLVDAGVSNLKSEEKKEAAST